VEGLIAEMQDCVIIGGGPAGAVFAARLRQRGLRVTLLERERFPRFHLGESLLPRSLHVLDAIGILPAIEKRFLIKRGAQFHHIDGGTSVRFDFADSFSAKYTYSFQVPRDEFDEVLLRHAQALGADVREGWTAEGLIREGKRVLGVRARSPNGVMHELAGF